VIEGTEVCDCPCHHPTMGQSVRHLISCCHRCTRCGKNIRHMFMLNHMKTCRPFKEKRKKDKV